MTMRMMMHAVEHVSNKCSKMYFLGSHDVDFQ